MEEMSPWASRRKTIILATIVLVLSSVSFIIFWKYWYRTPTCFDNIKNGDETGVDCGGSCSLICSNDVIKPVVRWDPRLFEVSSGIWSVLVYVENLNKNTDAIYVPYSFIIYDEKNNILEERKGVTILPKNKTVGIFEGNIVIKNEKKPRRAIFEIGQGIIWQKNENQNQSLTITNSPLLKLDSMPRVEANVKNNSTEEIKNIELVVAIFDGSDNAIASSRTFVETLKKNESTNVFFTWPKPFDLGSKVCEKHSNIMLLLDRSGSMSSLGLNPTQPLSQAKEAAISFVKQLGQRDKIGVVSFAANAKNPVDSTLISDFESANKIIESIEIEKSGTQYTNIYEALHSAWQELVSARASEEASKVVVLLTDGVANNPKDPQGKTEADDIKFAEGLAIKESLNLKKDGLVIYTIGLGNKINEPFLKNIASREENYFFAPSADSLENIYKDISSHICKEIPARIEITYKIFDTSN